MDKLAKLTFGLSGWALACVAVIAQALLVVLPSPAMAAEPRHALMHGAVLCAGDAAKPGKAPPHGMGACPSCPICDVQAGLMPPPPPCVARALPAADLTLPPLFARAVTITAAPTNQPRAPPPSV